MSRFDRVVLALVMASALIAIALVHGVNQHTLDKQLVYQGF